MSLENKVGRAVFDLQEVVKSRLATDLLQAQTEGRIVSFGSNEMTNLLSTVSASVEASFANGVDNFLRIVKASEEQTAVKPKRKTSSKTKT